MKAAGGWASYINETRMCVTGRDWQSKDTAMCVTRPLRTPLRCKCAPWQSRCKMFVGPTLQATRERDPWTCELDQCSPSMCRQSAHLARHGLRGGPKCLALCVKHGLHESVSHGSIYSSNISQAVQALNSDRASMAANMLQLSLARGSSVHLHRMNGCSPTTQLVAVHDSIDTVLQFESKLALFGLSRGHWPQCAVVDGGRCRHGVANSLHGSDRVTKGNADRHDGYVLCDASHLEGQRRRQLHVQPALLSACVKDSARQASQARCAAAIHGTPTGLSGLRWPEGDAVQDDTCAGHSIQASPSSAQDLASERVVSRHLRQRQPAQRNVWGLETGESAHP